MRVLAVLLGALAGLLLVAAPASAHGRGSDATNYRSAITEPPAAEGLRFRVVGADEYLGVESTSSEVLIVEGYQQEPYLRIGPDGVWVNDRSPATYLNSDRFARVDVPESADASAEPEWRQVADRPSWIWHDHRIHYMGGGLAPQVTDPAEPATVNAAWSVPFELGGEPGEVVGRLDYVPPTSSLPWLGIAALLVLPALAGLRTQPVPEDRWPGLARPMAMVLGAVAVLNLTQLLDDVFATPTPAGQKALAAGQTLLFLGIGLVGAVRGLRGRDGAFSALWVGSASLLVGQGLLYLPALSSSQSVSLLPAPVGRLAVALSLAQGAVLIPLASYALLRLAPSFDDESEDPGAAPAPA